MSYSSDYTPQNVQVHLQQLELAKKQAEAARLRQVLRGLKQEIAPLEQSVQHQHSQTHDISKRLQVAIDTSSQALSMLSNCSPSPTQ